MLWHPYLFVDIHAKTSVSDGILECFPFLSKYCCSLTHFPLIDEQKRKKGGEFLSTENLKREILPLRQFYRHKGRGHLPLWSLLLLTFIEFFINISGSFSNPSSMIKYHFFVDTSFVYMWSFSIRDVGSLTQIRELIVNSSIDFFIGINIFFSVGIGIYPLYPYHFPITSHIWNPFISACLSPVFCVTHRRCAITHITAHYIAWHCYCCNRSQSTEILCWKLLCFINETKNIVFFSINFVFFSLSLN